MQHMTTARTATFGRNFQLLTARLPLVSAKSKLANATRYATSR